MDVARLLVRFTRPAGALLVGGLLLAGCSSTQFGSQLSARPKPQAIRELESTTLRFPQSAPFAIALPRASKEAGLDGKADSDASAQPNGEAEVNASVTSSGKAEGLFQLGHAFANDTDRQMDLNVTVRFQCEFEAREEPDARLPDASVGLRLYARDERGRILRDIPLVDQSTENGTTQRQDNEDLHFTVTLGPGQSVDVFLAGQAKADIPSGRSASAKLKLRGLQFEVVTQPAPPVQAATQPLPPVQAASDGPK